MFRNKKRLFAFGCSFTNYNWNYTWPEIIKTELDIPLYNYGKIGVGNQYIFNTIMQADNYYKFNSNDLVMICWTGVQREDRYAYDEWHHTSNVFHNKSDMYSTKWIKKYCDTNGMALRDYATFKATDSLLLKSGVESYRFSMNSITMDVDNELYNQYKYTLWNIHDSFVKTLWHDDWGVKKKQIRNINPIVDDYHPSPLEHLVYLTKTLNYKFSDRVIKSVSKFQDEWEHILKQSKESRFTYKPYQLSQKLLGYI